MDIKELNKHQLILLTLLITFVVSIATGIVTVSLMNQAPKSVPYTVNNIIQRTIEKVTTVSEDAKIIDSVIDNKEDSSISLLEGDIVAKIYKEEDEDYFLGEGVLISEVGLILVENDILRRSDSFIIYLDNVKLKAFVLKKFENGFSILKIGELDELEESENSEILIIESEESEDFLVDKKQQ